MTYYNRIQDSIDHIESHLEDELIIEDATGQSPKAFKNGQKIYRFERINMMDKYIEVQDPELADKYPDIKLLKVLEPYRVAYYCYQGEEPESGAFDVISKWLQKSGLSFEKNKLRIFGFNNPSPSSPDQKAYGYEVWVTIGREVEVKDPKIKTKEITGGLYAVCGVKDLVPGGDGAEIYKAWMRLNAWLKDSRYRLGNHQWLEEHLSFNDAFEHFGGMDLYMPIDKK